MCICFSLLFTPFATALDITSEGAYLVDTVTGTVLYEKNPDQKMYPAGLTKIMTAILTLENSSLDEMVTISADAIAHGTGSGGYVKLKEGELISVQDLLYCLLLVSSNEAAWALAEHIAGDVSTFVGMMNAKAAYIGATSTHFTNPSGLQDEDHYTTPRDIWLITAYGAKNSQFIEISNSVERRISPTNLTPSGYSFYTDNHLISRFKSTGYMYKYAKGIIGGYTANAGYCLASTALADNDGPALVGVVMGGYRENRQEKIPSFVDMANLFTYAFENFDIIQVLRSGEMLGETNVALGKAKDYVSVSAGEDISILMPKGADASEVTRELHFEEELSAPITKGDVVGRVDLMYNGAVQATSTLHANFDVEKSQFLQFIQSISIFLHSGYMKVGAIILVILMVLYVIMTILSNRRRQMLLNSRRRRRRKF
jgi:D-alanyl-D-alanine carboxypeptidase (penicillin-binding protein 5/6)